jgi:hypothetical protein
MKRPKVLFHASPVNDLDLINPFNKTIRDINEGPVVFATPDYIYAMQFLIPVEDRWVSLGIMSGVHYMVISDEERFKKLDIGGTIYHLPTDNFSCDINTTMGEREWVCKIGVNPIKKDYFSKSLPAMLEKGIQIYFVDLKTFEEIKKSKDGGYKIIKGLKSENQKLGINPIEIK